MLLAFAVAFAALNEEINAAARLHYPQEDAVKLGERFGGAALKQLGETSGK